jgi:uncharacterized protein (TIGR03067 family)
MSARVAALLAFGVLLALRASPAGADDPKAQAPRKEPARSEKPKKDAVQQEYEAFKGTWKFASFEMEGQDVLAQSLKARLVLDGDRFTLKQGDMVYGGTFKVDVTSTPKRIDATFTKGPDKGKTMLGIYELKGDTYKVCFDVNGKNRPSEFASTPGSGHVLQVLKREEDDATRLQGNWVCASGKVDGKEIGADMVAKLRLELGKEKYTTRRGESVLFEGTYKVDATKSPKQIDIVATEGEQKGQIAHGIYRIDGDKHEICYTMPGKERPKEFASEPGSGAFLIVWKRAKSDGKQARSASEGKP